MRAAASFNRGHQTAKRSVTRVCDLPADLKPELDPDARLEKPTLALLQKGDIQLASNVGLERQGLADSGPTDFGLEKRDSCRYPPLLLGLPHHALK